MNDRQEQKPSSEQRALRVAEARTAIAYACTDLESACAKIGNAALDLTAAHPEHMGYLCAIEQVLEGFESQLERLSEELSNA